MKLPHIRQLHRRDWGLLTVGAAIMLAAVMFIQSIQAHQTRLPYQSAGITAQWIPGTVTHWSNLIDEMGKKYNIDANCIAIIMTMESGGNQNALSSDNAQGLMQITPATAKDIAARYLKKPVTTYNLSDPRTNIEFGAAYLALLRDTFGEASQGPSWNTTVELVAAGYNGGPGAANSLYNGTGLTDTQTVVYSRDVFNMWRERHASVSPTFERWKARGGADLLSAAVKSQQ